MWKCQWSFTSGIHGNVFSKKNLRIEILFLCFKHFVEMIQTELNKQFRLYFHFSPENLSFTLSANSNKTRGNHSNHNSKSIKFLCTFLNKCNYLLPNLKEVMWMIVLHFWYFLFCSHIKNYHIKQYMLTSRFSVTRQLFNHQSINRS